MVAGEDAEPAAVDGERVVDAKLCGKIGDRRLGYVRRRRYEPGVARRLGRLERQQDRVIPAEEGRVLGKGREPGGVHLAQQFDRIMPRHFPQGAVDGGEQPFRFGVPTPPQVVRQVAQTLNPRRQ